MKRALVIDSVVALLLSGALFWVGHSLVSGWVVETIRASFGAMVVTGPTELPWFQLRVGSAWALAPVVGWASALPLHRAPAPSVPLRLGSLLMPVAAVAGSALFNLHLLRLEGTAVSGPNPMVGVETFPLVKSAVVWAVVTGAMVLTFNWRNASAGLPNVGTKER